MEVGTGKGVQDPKGYAMACHECDMSLLLPVWYGVKLIVWGILWVCPYFQLYNYAYCGLSHKIAMPLYYHIPRKEWRS